ncbi:MAG: hypothetical protein KatS3mg084_0641 [Candidatus Dojkabacteria bacterium]|nr:MAG: hypothetical protein KatS3mg084_0641 [Candidatus Dojkabacteria bacterium]
MNTKISKIHGIILNKVPFGEKDMIFNLLDEDGDRKAFFVRGVQNLKSKFVGYIQIGYVLHIVCTKGKNFFYPQEMHLDLGNIFDFYKKSIDHLNCYLDLVNIAASISRDIHSKDLYQKLLSSLSALQQSTDSLEKIYNDYIEFCIKSYGIKLTELELIEQQGGYFYYHFASNNVFLHTHKPASIDVQLIRFDLKFKKFYLQKCFYNYIDNHIKLKF